MKGEERIDLNKIAAKYYKLGLLLSSFFKKENLNKVAFRDLYNFFDSPNINYLCHTDCAISNGITYWTHNVIREDGNAGKEKFKTRRDAEVDMFLNSFKHYDNILNPEPKYYHTYNDTSSTHEINFDECPF